MQLLIWVTLYICYALQYDYKESSKSEYFQKSNELTGYNCIWEIARFVKCQTAFLINSWVREEKGGTDAFFSEQDFSFDAITQIESELQVPMDRFALHKKGTFL